MKKLLTTLLTIVFFQSQVFCQLGLVSFPIIKPVILPSGSTTISIKNTGSKTEQVTKATIGQGEIKVGGQTASEEQLAGLNRDISKLQEKSKEEITGALDASVTIDNRVFTKTGRESIGSDITNIGKNLGQVYENITGNNIVVQSVKTALNKDNDLGLVGAVKQYIKLAKEVNFYVTSEGKAISTAQKDIDNLVSKLDVSIPKDKAVFYSGGLSNENVAKEFAKNNMLLTIEDTSGGLWLKEQNLYSNKKGDLLNSIVADKYWGTLSEKYASQASGTAHAFVNGAKPERIFYSIEYPTLKSNSKIDLINFYNNEMEKIKWEAIK